MLRRFLQLACGCAAFLILPLPGQMPSAVPHVASVRIMFGLTDSQPSPWDGTVALDSGSVKAIQGVRFGPEDSTDYSTSWKTATRLQGQDVAENGVMITALAQADARWSIHTARGDFSFTLRDLPWGEQRSFLDGAVEVDRIPPTAQLTTSDDDEDFPAVARAGDDIWLSYVRFSHSNRSLESFQTLREPLDNFESLARPAGGDQVFARHYSKDGVWSAPVAISPNAENVTRTAVAIDGRKCPWIFWSAQRNGSFNLFAKVNRNGLWSPEIRVTSGPGPDLQPVAATDAKGRVWVAWQGYRNNNLEILAAVQNGDSFGSETLVSTSKASDWDPAIAASPNGDIAVSWDTYNKGDYDVYFSRMRSDEKSKIELDPPVTAAATPFFEAHSSIAFDAHNRLWLAYETSTARWGKNFGAYDSTGTPLYEDRNIRVKCFDGGAVFSTSADLLNVMPGPPMAPRRAPRAKPERNPSQPNPNAAKNRRPGQLLSPRARALNSFPRIATDSAGDVYLAFRSLSTPVNLRSAAGSVWVEHVVCFDGHKWIGPVFLPRTDGLLDSRPALLALEPGRLIAFSAMDHRQSIPLGLGPLAPERINSDLYLADLTIDGISAASTPELAPLAADGAQPEDPRVKAEADQVSAVRNYRLDIGGRQLRILRGDMHRHTAYSPDGARDGSLDDAYRYLIDAADLDWAGCCDTENGEGHEYFWWRQQTMADAYKLGDRFLPMFAFEHAVRYPEGHRVILFAKRGIRPVPHLPAVAVDAAPAPSPDTQMLYKYLHQLGGISVPHTPATDMGTDWRDSDPEVEPAVEIYQGDRQSYESDDAPRAAKPGDALGNLRPAGYVLNALNKGLRLGFVASSDHYSTHISFANVITAEVTRAGILDAIRKRHTYGSTDNIIADVRVGDHIMGDEFTVSSAPEFSVKLLGTAPFAKVVIIKDGQEAYSGKDPAFHWTDNAAASGKTSWYYVRGEQTDGQLVWASPMWITMK